MELAIEESLTKDPFLSKLKDNTGDKTWVFTRFVKYCCNICLCLVHSGSHLQLVTLVLSSEYESILERWLEFWLVSSVRVWSRRLPGFHRWCGNHPSPFWEVEIVRQQSGICQEPSRPCRTRSTYDGDAILRVCRCHPAISGSILAYDGPFELSVWYLSNTDVKARLLKTFAKNG